MEEKKIKQSIVSIAVFLGLLGYYSTHRSNGQPENAEMGINVFSHDIGNKVKQGEVLQANFGPESPGIKPQSSDSTFFSGFIRFIPNQ